MPSKHAGHPVSVRLSTEDVARLRRLAQRYGTQAATIVAGLQMLDGANDIDLPAALERAAAELRKRGVTAAPPIDPPAKPAPESPAQQPENGADRARSRFAKRAE